MRVYLDNCCYNRPYDDQFQPRIYVETEAKLHIQDLIKDQEIELATSYVLDFENSKNVADKKGSIEEFMNSYETVYIGSERSVEVELLKHVIMKTGIKDMDACHVACAILAECDFFITTDDRLLKYRDDRIQLISPCDFVNLYEEEYT